MQSLVNYIKGDELPSPTTPIEIAEGILWFRLPMPIALDHINIYLLEDNEGWVLIDTGMADPVSIETWEIILKEYTTKRPIKKIIGTHFHPDHVGLAGWLIERTDAEFWMSQIEWLSARQAYLDAEGRELIKDLCEQLKEVPSLADDEGFYIDFGASGALWGHFWDPC